MRSSTDLIIGCFAFTLLLMPSFGFSLSSEVPSIVFWIEDVSAIFYQSLTRSNSARAL